NNMVPFFKPMSEAEGTAVAPLSMLMHKMYVMRLPSKAGVEGLTAGAMPYEAVREMIRGKGRSIDQQLGRSYRRVAMLADPSIKTRLATMDLVPEDLWPQQLRGRQDVYFDFLDRVRLAAEDATENVGERGMSALKTAIGEDEYN